MTGLKGWLCWCNADGREGGAEERGGDGKRAANRGGESLRAELAFTAAKGAISSLLGQARVVNAATRWERGRGDEGGERRIAEADVQLFKFCDQLLVEVSRDDSERGEEQHALVRSGERRGTQGWEEAEGDLRGPDL
eukprot:644760-Hanusia_phi.AAC.1